MAAKAEVEPVADLQETHDPLVLRVGKLFDGRGGTWERAELWIEHGQVRARGRWGEFGVSELPGAAVQEFPDNTVIPGMVDTHVHVTFGDLRPTYEEFMEDSDTLMALRAVESAKTHLRSGVTVLRDLGARHDVTLVLKDAVERAVIPNMPRVQAVGRPITITGGHFWFCGEEADGPEAVMRSVRRLVKEGADAIKLMGSGGGTLISDPKRASFTEAEVRAAVEEAHRHRKQVIIHCHATQSIANAVAAGVDGIEHCSFLEPDGSVRFDRELAQAIVDKGIRICPTPHVLSTRVRWFEHKLEQGLELTAFEEARYRDMKYRVDQNIETSARLRDMGATIIAGSDVVWEFGDYHLTYESLLGMGMSAGEAVETVTHRSAADLGLAGVTGSLEPGKDADLVLLWADPEADRQALRRISNVMRAGVWVN